MQHKKYTEVKKIPAIYLLLTRWGHTSDRRPLLSSTSLTGKLIRPMNTHWSLVCCIDSESDQFNFQRHPTLEHTGNETTKSSKQTNDIYFL